MLKAEGYEVISSSAGHDQHFFASEQAPGDANGQEPLQNSAEFAQTCNAQAHQVVDAITATVANAQAGLNWLRAEPPDLEEVRRALDNVANAGNRAAEAVVRLRSLMKTVPTKDGAPDPSDSPKVAGAEPG
ncbi:hypothetical protein [Bradyrhizobium lablabi]|uniref:hypothetical protein n=1 Tax=Bradyrhizobium lablabi TaxID=722472 RepID=UPI001BA5399F|nr:hypothetical protein [Bradyrhizobium lablabi]MBR0693402.1 hypothetical protein [Bradyrhizobium lablabi]